MLLLKGTELVKQMLSAIVTVACNACVFGFSVKTTRGYVILSYLSFFCDLDVRKNPYAVDCTGGIVRRKHILS